MRATLVDFLGGDMVVHLDDGRKIRAPLTRFHRLSGAQLVELNAYQLTADGQGICWPALNEDLSVAGLVRDFGVES